MGYIYTKKLLGSLKFKLHWVLVFAFAGFGNPDSKEAGQAASREGYVSRRQTRQGPDCSLSPPRPGALSSGAAQSMAVVCPSCWHPRALRSQHLDGFKLGLLSPRPWEQVQKQGFRKMGADLTQSLPDLHSQHSIGHSRATWVSPRAGWSVFFPGNFQNRVLFQQKSFPPTSLLPGSKD